MTFKIGWVLFAIYAYIGIGMNAMPIKEYQQQYLAQARSIQNISQVRVDRIYQIVDSEYDDNAIMQKIKQEKLY